MPGHSIKHTRASSIRITPVADSVRTPELPDVLQAEVSRRSFLKAAGFSFVGAMVLGCARAPEQEAIPLLEQSTGMIPGRSDYYATTCGACSAGCGILARSRDGRPIKLEGNPEHPLSRGGLCAVGQAALLGLYDSRRLRGPLAAGAAVTWEHLDDQLGSKLESLRRSGGRVRYLSSSITSPTKRDLIAAFLAGFADGRHVIYDPAADSALLDAHERTHRLRAAPRYHFDRSRYTVSFDCDFLGTWLSPVEFTRDYSAGRQANDVAHGFSEHVQFESRMSITGAKADRRLRTAPGERGLLLSHLASRVASHAGRHFNAPGLDTPSVGSAELDTVAATLWRNRGQSLVVCGADDVGAQLLCNFINDALGNYGTTLDLAHPSYQAQGNEAELNALTAEITAGRVDALFVDGVNPALELPWEQGTVRNLAAIPLLVSFAQRLDETSVHAHYSCPDHHFLESWGDAEAVHGVFSFTQPLVNPLGRTRPVIESLDRWSGGNGTGRNAHDLLQERWGNDARWDRRIHDGFEVVPRNAARIGALRSSAVRAVRTTTRPGAGELSLVLYSKAGMPHAGHAYNPWLQELPDPITKAVWDNYACLSPATAERLGLAQGDVVRLAAADCGAIELPVLPQPGQHDEVVAVAMGYGAELSRRFADIGPQWIERRPTVGPNGLVGVSTTPLLSRDGGRRRFSGTAVTLTVTGRSYPLSLTQDHHSIDVPEHLAPKGGRRRPNIQESTVAALQSRSDQVEDTAHGHHGGSMWPDDHEYKGHHWGMAIDLTTCTGCSACVVACQVENNVPVVGKDEVGRNREMHWIRIDRYYAGEGDSVDVAHQPMMCHHCDNAPCETVCPVLATVHSEEGLNQQAYNRCVGTRYCMNNCPFKVRRFNWFEYSHEDEHQNMTLNPDVTIRSRGIMEKCSLCAQRILEAKTEAKRQGIALRDGDVQMACQQSCPAKAIVFGDMNDPESEIARAIADGRHYRVLEETNIRPTVGYMSLVRNRPEAGGHDHHG